MRIVPFITTAIITTGLVWALNKPWGSVPPMGKFLSPQIGFWQNAEPAGKSFSANFKFPGLKGKVSVYMDENLVPHVFAENDEDLYFVQGYLHAQFRLFQMDLQTKAAEGRASEIAGKKAIRYDRYQRRLGMRYAAEKALVQMEKDPVAKAMFDSYTNGINAYIGSLKESNIPLEYKLLNLKPEKWSNLRTALLLKMMANMLTGETEKDLPYTNSKSVFSDAEMKILYPQVPDSLQPIVPAGTAFDAPGIVPVAPAGADSIYLNNPMDVPNRVTSESDISNGSNNWVVAGSKTKSGAPILCNDPHLELTLPSIWYEMQLSTPTHNVYGVSLPGSPFVIIGFNDSVAWGVTNAQRDVKDYYSIQFRDNSRKEYWFDGKWLTTDWRVEKISVKDSATVYDSVAYTIFGPVVYDNRFSTDQSHDRNIALRWVAHDPSDDGMALYYLNRAHNYDEYVNAIKYFECPGQNFVFASKTGDIAIWQQGKFPARWNRQGLYVMPGTDSSYMWQGFIPQAENPHSKNPERGFLESGNQRPADSTYPYFIPGSYITPRAISITQHLYEMNSITPADMMKLQNNYYNVQAAYMYPLMMKYTQTDKLLPDAKKYFDMVKGWNFDALPSSKAQTVYKNWFDTLQVMIWKDELSRVKPAPAWPWDQTLIEALLRDSAFSYIDNINTPAKETLFDVMTDALNKASVKLADAEAKNKLEWASFKEPGVYHLLDKSKKDLLPLDRPGLKVGGDGNIINAVTQSHGPSWRMIVQLTGTTEAYGVYPGGQDGNPGSKYYDNFIDNWVEGKYHPLWLMRSSENKDERVKWTMNFEKK